MIVWLAFAACSSGANPPGHPTPPKPTGSADAGTLAATSPSAQECDQLIAHVVDVTLREHPPEPAPSEAESQQIDRALRPFAAECSSLTREAYRCGMAAATVASLTACQERPSSSTSNSSVAPGGIAPPAP
ncbi:hypothetical protein BH11MYX3_BH11MYX3_42020 [soil metagenome]